MTLEDRINSLETALNIEQEKNIENGKFSTDLDIKLIESGIITSENKYNEILQRRLFGFISNSQLLSYRELNIITQSEYEYISQLTVSDES